MAATATLRHSSPGNIPMSSMSMNPCATQSTRAPSIRFPPGSGPDGRLNVILADEQAVVREGVAALLTRHAGIAIVGSTSDGDECARLGMRDDADLIIFGSLSAGSRGIDVVRRMAAYRPRLRMLCLSSHDDAPSVRAAFDAGVHGYVAKRCSFAVLAEAIEHVFRCGCYVSPDIAHVLVDGFRSRCGMPDARVTRLSAREREVARLYAEGLGTREIAAKLHLSMKTVGTHRDHVMEKLGVRGIARLTRYAIREGLVALDA
ncbi:two-component system secretion response regulator SsrB [Luteibacter sp. PvP120]